MEDFITDFESFKLVQGTIKSDDGTNEWAGLFLGRLIDNAAGDQDLMVTAFIGPAAPILQQVEAKFPGKTIVWSVAVDSRMGFDTAENKE